jgi:tyrosyl-tRNA synthetase
MSSSWGNTVNLLDEPSNMFGKIMSIPDELIVKYFIHCTRVDMEKINQIGTEIKLQKINPRDAKLELAFEITKIYHGKDAAQKAQENFVNTFSKKGTPEDIQEIKMEKPEMKITEFLVLAKLAQSASDARRKIEQGGVEINGEKIIDWKLSLDSKNDGAVIKVGKFGFVKIKF